MFTASPGGSDILAVERDKGGPLDPLEELIARDQIHQLADRYAIGLDAKDMDTVAMLFVEDVNSGRYGSGREGVKAFLDYVLRQFHCSMHLVGNHVIDFDDEDRAHGIVYCRAHHHVLEPEHWHDMSLAYWDTYERHGGRWYFRRRRIKAWYDQWFGHPEHGTERVLATPGTQGALRGSRMPEAFETFDAFWGAPPASPPAKGG